MHDLADFADVLFEHAMRRGIGNHDRREPVRMLRGFDAQIIDIDVAARVAFDDDDIHADHLRRCWIGAVRGGGDQADGAVGLAARGMIAADREQAGIFALRAGIRLQRNRVIAGDGAKPSF